MWWDQVTSDRTIGIQFLIALSKKFFGNSLFVIYIPIIIAAVLMLYCTYQLHKELIKDKNPIANIEPTIALYPKIGFLELVAIISEVIPRAGKRTIYTSG